MNLHPRGDEAASSINPAHEEITSETIATYLGAEHWGEPVCIDGIGSLEGASPRALAFSVYDDPEKVRETEASAVICAASVGRIEGSTQIIVDHPRLAFARVCNALFPPSTAPAPGIHDTAVIAEGANLGANITIGPHVYIGPTVEIGDRCYIGPGSVIGAPGFGYERDESGAPHHLPHYGGVVIESDVSIGSNCTIDRSLFSVTKIARETKLSAQVHIAHNVELGEAVLVACGVKFGGGASVGSQAMIHPNAAIAEGIHIGDHATVGINSAVLTDVEPETTVVGSPARQITSNRSI